MNKAALLHDIINDFQLDFLALSETWVCASAPDAIKMDLAPAGFTVNHTHRNRQGGIGGLLLNTVAFVILVQSGEVDWR